MSDYQSEHPTAGCVIAVLVVLGLAVWALSSAFRPRDPNPELIKIAQDAVRMADEARKDAESARRSANTLRVVGIILGSTAPLVVAYLIYRLHAKAEARPEDVMEALEARCAVGPAEKQPQELPTAARRLINAPGRDRRGGGEQDK